MGCLSFHKPSGFHAWYRLLALGLLSPMASQAQNTDVCRGFDAKTSLPFAQVLSIHPQAADAGKNLTDYCEIKVAISPVAGSRTVAIYRLPAKWNGKFLGIGGGGFAGNLSLAAAQPGLGRGYAVMQNDMGHPSENGLDPSFAVLPNGKANTEGIIDFGHRATHLSTTVGQQLVKAFYQQPLQRSYWQGCSTGGRQGLAEIQRYPQDYDGVIAGAPVYTPLVYSNAILRVQAFHAKPESNLLPAHVPLIQKALLAACDAKDGVVDGILTDPRTCSWNPAQLQCTGAAGPDCLTPAQVQTVQRVYDGVKTKDGRWAAMPLMRGGEADWVVRMIGTPEVPRGRNSVLGAPFVSHIVKANPAYDIMTYDPDRDLDEISSGIAGEHVHQPNADISSFLVRGGKLLLWHGFNDPGPSPLSTIDYLQAVQNKVPAHADSVKLFLAPGVLHCSGGPGPDQFDTLSALENWVENGKTPTSMLATKANGKMSRPLCAYPQVARYLGQGDTLDAKNFQCATP